MNALQDCKHPRKETESQGSDTMAPKATDGDEQRIDSLEATAKKHPRSQEALRRMTDSTFRSSASLSDMSQNSAGTDVESYRPIKKADDPFLYYSSHKRRMEHLIGRELPNLLLEPVVRRRSRISFELDPVFDLMTTFPDLEGEWFEEEMQQE